jgi:hypothetical protein
VRDAQVNRDLTQVALWPGLVLHHRCAANHFQVSNPGKASEDFVLHTISEVSVLFLIT